MRLVCLIAAFVSLASLRADGAERGTVEQTLTAVERWLARQPDAHEMREYLQMATLRAGFTANGQPDSSAVETFLRRVGAERAPTRLREAPEVDRLCRTLERWLARQSMPVRPQMAVVAWSILRHAPPYAADTTNSGVPTRQWLRPRLIALLASLASYADQPTDRLATEIAAQLDVLSASPDAAGLVAAVRDYYSHPNLWIDVSEEILDRSIGGDLDRQTPVEAVILGTPLAGDGRLRAVRKLTVEPRENASLLKLVVTGTIASDTVGHRGPVRINSHALTSFRAEKSLVIDRRGVTILPTTCQAETHTANSHITTSKGGLRGRIVRRVAQRRLQSWRDKVDQESAMHARKRLTEEIDREAAMLVARLEGFTELPLIALKNLSGCGEIEVCGDRRVLRIGTIVGPLGAPPSAPCFEHDRLIAMRIHESLALRLSQGRLGAAVAAALPAQFNPTEMLQVAVSSLVGSSPTSPSRSTPAQALRLPILATLGAGGWRPGSMAWSWFEHLAAPRLTAQGVILRDGQWGLISPVSAGGEWLSAEWKPVGPRARVASAANRP